MRDVLPVVAEVSPLLVLSATAPSLVEPLVLATATPLAALSLDLLPELPSDVRADHL